MTRSERAPLAAYGTLQFPEILEALLGRVPEVEPVAIVDHEARRLPGVAYPGLVAVRSEACPAQLLVDLSIEEWGILDDYEDDFYELLPVVVQSQAGEQSGALSYVVPSSLASAAIWTPDWFLETHLETFLGELRGFDA